MLFKSFIWSQHIKHIKYICNKNIKIRKEQNEQIKEMFHEVLD